MVIHPQSIVHSMVEFVDGSVIAQLESAGHETADSIRFDLSAAHGLELRRGWIGLQALTLEFEPPDLDRFPALQLGMEVAAVGGTAGAVLNAANEAAVASFGWRARIYGHCAGMPPDFGTS